jgi:predicted phage baseplate assembly protein
MNFPPNELEPWIPVPDLLESHPFDRQFVVETENDGSATLRFGDDEYGRLPADVLDITGRYRVGNGSAGNIGSGSLAHIVSPVVLGSWPTVQKVRQPLPAYGGTEAESIEEVRQLAPRAFQAEQFRAVTESDYERAVLKLASVVAANCTFRWTGSWLTVFVAIHTRNPADLITETGGRTRLSESLERKARAQLMRYKLAGYDLEVRTAQYVPLEISVEICVARGYFRGDVLEGVSRALSNRQYADGTTGFFHPSRFAFGQGIYVSQLYDVVEKVEGVDSAVVKVFKRYWMIANNELENGLIPIGPLEIARLDNDPNFMENGVLRLTALGGL